MRHVKYDPTKISYPRDWNSRARTARESVNAALPEKKSEEVNKHRDVWADIKPELAKIMSGKCWYTEAPQVGTDSDVDHFRPKNAVNGVRKPSTGEEHSGYWWRAFEPENFRFSCIVANRRRRDLETGHVGGKADEFPIWDESKRAWQPTDDCDEEQPLLIDPCKASEVALITFGANGEATPRYSHSEKPRLYAKADTSIKLYHLNHSDFVRARIEIRVALARNIQDAKRYFRNLDTADTNTEHAYMRAIEELRNACSEISPFSSFAIAFLAPHRSEESLAPVFC